MFQVDRRELEVKRCMQVNADFSQRALVNIQTASWVASPQAGVARLLLDRIGAEVARATSVVRFEAGSSFPRHEHGGGEEILVLEGIFSDETGHYPAGSYVRNPPGTAHAPWSEQGCTIWVKLWQFAPDDNALVRFHPDRAPWEPTEYSGLWVQRLHQHATEATCFYRCTSKLAWSAFYALGAELLVIEGCLVEQGIEYSAGTWLRLPVASHCDWQVTQGTLIYLKVGHLNQLTCWDQREAQR